MAIKYSKKTLFFNSLMEYIAAALFLPRIIWPKKKSENEPIRILLVEPFGMGDVLSLSVMLDPIKSAYPDSDIYLLTKNGNEDIYAKDSRITHTFTAPIPWSKLSGQKKGSFSEWKSLFKVCRNIADLKPDIGLDTRSEIRSQILMLLCNCKNRIGFKNYLNTNINVKGLLLTKVVDKPEILHRYQMNRLLVKKGLDVNIGCLVFPTYKPTFEKLPNKTEQTSILIHIGGRWKYRQWTNEKWIELIKKLSKENNLEISVTCGIMEKAMLDNILEKTSITGEVSDYNLLVNKIKSTDLLICLDSGPMHLAQTLGIPVLALFGPGDFDLWHPLGKNDKTCFHKLECNPCLQHVCIKPEKPCMSFISVEDVYMKTKEVLKVI
jgi:heptosyltransferase III